MATYLCVKTDGSTEPLKYEAKSTADKPYLKVDSSYFPLTSQINGTGLRIKGHNATYQIVDSYTTTSESTYASVIRSTDNYTWGSGAQAGMPYRYSVSYQVSSSYIGVSATFSATNISTDSKKMTVSIGYAFTETDGAIGNGNMNFVLSKYSSSISSTRKGYRNQGGTYNISVSLTPYYTLRNFTTTRITYHEGVRITGTFSANAVSGSLSKSRYQVVSDTYYRNDRGLMAEAADNYFAPVPGKLIYDYEETLTETVTITVQ